MKFKSILTAAAMLTSVLAYSQVPTADLIKEYRFQGGSLLNTSTYPDPLPVGTIDLTQTGSAMTTIADRGGIATQAISTNGDYFAAGGSPVNTTQQLEEMTASFWIKTNTSDANNRNLLRQYNGIEGFVCYINNGVVHLDGRFRFYRVSPAGWWNSGYHALTANNGSIADNQWHHVVIQTEANSSADGQGNTYSRLDLKIWIDNVNVGSLAGIDYTYSVGVQRSNAGATTEMFVGTSGTSPQPTEVYNDEIDDIRVYRRALNSTEIGQLFNEQVNPCTSPTAVAVSNPTATTVDVDWTDGGSETSWEVEAVVSGGAQGSGTVQTAGSHPYTFTGLNANTDYDFYVRAHCGGGSFSGWTSPETASTACGIQTCEIEDFSSAVLSPCWTAVASNGGNVAVTNISGELKLRMGPSINSTFTAALPEMASVNGYLSFNASNSTNTATPYYFVIGTMSDPTDQGTFTAYQTVSFNGASGITPIEVDLTGYSGTDKFIAFRYVYGTNINVHVYIDDVQFTDGSCFWNTAFVDANATGNNDGTSWADAYTDLQDALFNYNGDPIWVAQGTYKPGATREATFSIPSGAKIYGGFDKTESWLSQRDLDNNITTLSGDINGDDNGTLLHTEPTRQDNSYHIVTFKGNVQGALLNGFTVSGANANGPNDISCATPAASQVINTRGGAIYANPYTTGMALTADVTQCVLENNTGTDVAVYAAFTPCGVTGLSYNVDFDRCIIRNNYSHVLSNILLSGSSGYSIIGSTSIYGSVFYGNSAPAYASCLFISTSTANGGNSNGVSGQIINNTFADNTGFPAAIYYSNGQNTGLKNNIIWNNGDNSPINGSGGPSVAHYNLVEGGYGSNTINADPLFVDAPNGDYRLMTGSPAIDAGYNTYVANSVDINGTSRILDGTVDLGAYEFFIPPCVSSAPTIDGFSNLSHHGTTISWTPTDVPTGGKFVVRYHKFGDSPNFSWKVVPDDRTSAYINGLDANQQYVFRVGGRCPGETMAVYSDTMSVTTKPYCPQATNLNGVRTSGATATISWDDMGADVYKIKYRETGGSWTYRNVAGPATTLDITGMNPASTYEWKIRTICNDGGNKPYSAMQNIGTYNPRLAAADIEGFNTYPNPTNGWVNLEFNSNYGGDIRIAVRDLSGRVLIRETITVSEGNVRTTMDLSDLSTGTYLLELNENSGLSHTSRVMKR